MAKDDGVTLALHLAYQQPTHVHRLIIYATNPYITLFEIDHVRGN